MPPTGPEGYRHPQTDICELGSIESQGSASECSGQAVRLGAGLLMAGGSGPWNSPPGPHTFPGPEGGDKALACG